MATMWAMTPGSSGTRADAVAKRYRPWPKGLRADSLPWFDSPLVQGASQLRYTDKAQIAATGPYWPKGARNKKNWLKWHSTFLTVLRRGSVDAIESDRLHLPFAVQWQSREKSMSKAWSGLPKFH